MRKQKEKKTFSPWIFNGEPYELPDEKLVGFVYMITDTKNNRGYIGKKIFWSKRTKMVKGKKKKVKSESDWKSYFGSNDQIQSLLQTDGPDIFKRQILYLCPSLGSMSYLQAREQFDRRVLEDEYWYNSWIMIKTRHSHLGKLGDCNVSNQLKSKESKDTI